MHSESPTKSFALAPILCFLAVSFFVTYSVSFFMISDGIRFDAKVLDAGPLVWLLANMWVPGLTALLVVFGVEKRPVLEVREALWLWIGSLGPYALCLFLVPLAYAVMYGLTWAAGLSQPDPTLSGLVAAAGGDAPLSSDTVFDQLLPLSIVVGPILNYSFALGEEMGWRGFLLPRLMVLGKAKAYVILGIIWGLWHGPLILAGFNYPGHPVSGLAMMCVLTFAFSLFLNEMTLYYRSTLLAAFIHAAANAQGFGIWPWMFPDTNRFLGGSTGVTGIVVWLCLGGITAIILNKRKKTV